MVRNWRHNAVGLESEKPREAHGAKKGLIKGMFDLGPFGWAVVTLLLWIVGFPAYLAKRGEIKRLASGNAQK
jgi:hypothetical protein